MTAVIIQPLVYSWALSLGKLNYLLATQGVASDIYFEVSF